MSPQYIDIHTHALIEQQDTISIYNRSSSSQDRAYHSHSLFSLSLHPWNLPASWEEAQAFLEHYLSHPHCVALGEIGLDKKQSENWASQVSFFEKAVQFACAQKVKVIILHSVKAHQDCLKILKDQRFEGAIIFHDYHGSWEQTSQLLERPQVYLSLGALLGRPQSKLQGKLASIPLERLFLETDDSCRSIVQRYEDFCALSGHDIMTVRTSCFNNYQKLFL